MIIIATPNAPHPQAHVQTIDLLGGAIAYRWLGANGQPVDSGGSVARFTPGADLPTEAEISAAIEASTVAP